MWKIQCFIWIRILKFGPIWMRMQTLSQTYIINFEEVTNIFPQIVFWKKKTISKNYMIIMSNKDGSKLWWWIFCLSVKPFTPIFNCVDPDPKRWKNIYISYLEVLHAGPPGAVEVVHLVLLAELLQGPPIGVGHPEPLRVPGPDVDVDRGKVVVLLMARRSRSGNLGGTRGNWVLTHGRYR